MDQTLTLLKILKIETSKTFPNSCKFIIVAFSSAICERAFSAMTNRLCSKTMQKEL